MADPYFPPSEFSLFEADCEWIHELREENTMRGQWGTVMRQFRIDDKSKYDTEEQTYFCEARDF